jgi:hypothetical protein
MALDVADCSMLRMPCESDCSQPFHGAWRHLCGNWLRVVQTHSFVCITAPQTRPSNHARRTKIVELFLRWQTGLEAGL